MKWTDDLTSEGEHDLKLARPLCMHGNDNDLGILAGNRREIKNSGI